MSRIQDNKKRAGRAAPHTAIAPDRFAASIPHAITRLFREQNRIYGRAVEPLGLSAEQAHLLLLLWTRGPLSMGELGRESALSSGTLSAAIDRMEKAGLVARAVDAKDRRGVRVTGVAWPAAKQRQLVDALDQAEHEVIGSLGKSERQVLWELLDKVLGGMG